jgi:hypothetical protein
LILLTRKEKETLVIKLAKEEKTYRDIAKIVHIYILFDKFFQRQFWEITDEHTRTIIPNTMDEKFPSILSK